MHENESPPISPPRTSGLLMGVVLSLIFGFFGVFWFVPDAVPPDPNEPDRFGQRSIEVIEQEVKQFYSLLARAERRGRIDEATRDKMFRDFVVARAKSIRVDRISNRDAWRYGEIFRAARDWAGAEKIFAFAVKVAGANEDRRVNDSLRWAQAKAHLGQVDEAIQIARFTFDAPPGNKPPILFGVYLEIVPAARGKGYDAALAQLIRDAVEQSREAIVVPESAGGAAFLQTREYHIAQALKLADELAPSAAGESVSR